MEVLQELYRKRGKVVTKDDLIEAVWKRFAVTDHAVTVVISDLRSALGDDSRNPRFIETIPKRGYRLIEQAAVRTEISEPAKTDQGARSLPRPAGLVKSLFAVAAICLAGFGLVNILNSPPRQIVLVDTENLTNRADFDALASSLSAIALDLSLQQDDVPIVRWRDSGGREPSAARWRIETQLLETEGGPTSTIQVLKAGTREILWNGSAQITSDRFSRAHSVLFTEALQEIGVNVEPLVKLSSDPAAEDLYWKARLFWDLRSETSAHYAQSLLAENISRFPEHAKSHAALVDLYAHKTGAFFADKLESPRDEAKKHLRQAIELASDLFETRLAAAHFALFAEGDAPAALTKLSALVDEKPSYSVAWRSYATALAANGEFNAAMAAIETARALDPLNPVTAWDAVWIFYVAGAHDVAMESILAAEALGGDGDLYRGLIHASEGADKEALKVFAGIVGRQEPFETFNELYLEYTELPEPVQNAVFSAAFASLAGRSEVASEILAEGDEGVQVWARLWRQRAPFLNQPLR